MAHCSSALSTSLSNMHNGLGHFKMPLSEPDIMLLQDMFLTPGLHTITVDTPEKGRQIMHQIVPSLSYYRVIAALSLLCPDFATLPQNDVYAHVYDYIRGKDLQDDFFDGYYDVIWIESTSALLTTPWYSTLEQKLIETSKNRTISIVIVAC